jgi:non-specific serine/threonine protein kinase
VPKRPVVSPKSSASRPANPAGFGELLKRHRSRAGYSQDYLAEKARVSAETIGALERGARRAPNSGTLDLLCDALEIVGDERLALEKAASAARARPGAGDGQPNGRTNNLPEHLTPLVGREDDVVRLTALLESHRLVTVTGPSGVGKSRVGLEAAARHARSRGREVWLVDLATLGETGSVTEKIASVLGQRATSLHDLTVALRAREMLLIVDNCEHLVAEVSVIALTLLLACRGIGIVVGSSERLGVAGETVFRLPPLSLPGHVPQNVQEARRYSAVSLFMERAQTDSNLVIGGDKIRQIVQICRDLEGNPRAIELAAARLSGLALRELQARLNERSVLTGGGRDLPPRQQTPLEAVDWSYNGLADPERLLLRRLSVFVAAHTLEDAEAVCAGEDLAPERVAEILDSLAHKSLLAVTHAGDVTRYRLFNFVRSYGLEKLAECGELELLLQRRARWFAHASGKRAILSSRSPVDTESEGTA